MSNYFYSSYYSGVGVDHHFVKYSVCDTLVQHVVKVYICPIHIILILAVYLTSAILYMTYRLLPNVIIQ